MADRDLRKTHLPRQRRDLSFVRRIAVSVHEDDGDGLDAVGLRGFERRAYVAKIGRPLDRAVGAHALVDLDDALIEHVRFDDVLGENLGPGLITDPQRIAEAASRHQQRALAFAFQQRIGGDGGAHLDRADTPARQRLAGLEAHQVADALHGGVAIGLGIFREQLVGDQRAVRASADHVGERAAAVDPEIPLRGCGHGQAPCCRAETGIAPPISSNRKFQ